MRRLFPTSETLLKEELEMPRDVMRFDNGGRILWVCAFTEISRLAAVASTNEVLCFRPQTVRVRAQYEMVEGDSLLSESHGIVVRFSDPRSSKAL